MIGKDFLALGKMCVPRTNVILFNCYSTIIELLSIHCKIGSLKKKFIYH